MKTMPLILTLLTLLFVSCDNSSDRQTGWRGPDRNGVVSDFDAPAEWPSQLKQVWKQNVGLCDASPVLLNNRLYLHVKQGENEVTLCLDAETGEQLWSTVNNVSPEVTGGARPHPGPRSTPYVAGGKVYTVGVGGALNCLDAQTGEVLWTNTEYTEVPDFFVSVSPLIHNNVCYVHLGGREAGAVVAFDAAHGGKLWELKGHPATYSSPVVFKVDDEEVLVVQTETNLIGISLDGKLLWQVPTPGERRFYNSSTPVIDGQNLIVAGQGLGTKSFRVTKTGDRYSLLENWANPDYGVSFNTPLLKEGYLYGHEARLGKLFCLNAATGETCWADSTAHNRFASNLDLGSEILSLTANGNLLVYEANPEKYVEKRNYTVSNTNIYAHPVVSGNKIFTKDKEHLTCWEVN